MRTSIPDVIPGAMPPNDLVTEIDTDTAADFWSALEPTHNMWGDGVAPKWIFRGQADASWDLVPSLWRDATRKKHTQLYRRHEDRGGVLASSNVGFARKHGYSEDDIEEACVMAYLERDLVERFASLADELGLNAFLDTNEPPSVRTLTDFVSKRNAFITTSPTDILNKVTALAQHHGVPTRFLDWTHNSKIAAYFALNSGPKEGDVPERLAVWAFNMGIAALHSTLQVFRPPRHNFSFLHAQAGLFVVMMSAETYLLRNRKWPDLVSFLQDLYTQSRADGGLDPHFVKITLPCTEEPKLREILVKNRLTRAHLMPTFDNVAYIAHYHAVQGYPK